MKNLLLPLFLLPLVAFAQEPTEPAIFKDIAHQTLAVHNKKMVNNTIAAEILLAGSLASWYGIVNNPYADQNLASFMRPITITAFSAGLITAYCAGRHAYFRDKKLKAGISSSGLGIQIHF